MPAGSELASTIRNTKQREERKPGMTYRLGGYVPDDGCRHGTATAPNRVAEEESAIEQTSVTKWVKVMEFES